MTTVYLAPGSFGAGGQFFGLGGLPLTLGTITTYAAGGTTPLATYTTSLGNVQNANPIVLGLDGRPPNEIWVTAVAYRFDLKDALGNLIKTYDNLVGSVDGSFTQNGTGAVAGSTQTELRRIWYPEQFGAVGDGVTDDAAAWALLLNAAGSSNFEIHGKPGSIYLLGAVGITVTSKTNGRIVANGSKIKLNAAATQTVGTVGSTAIKIDTCTNVYWSGWECDGNSKASNFIGLLNCIDCEVSFNRVTASGVNAQLLTVGGTRNRIIRNVVYSAIGSARGIFGGNVQTTEIETDILIDGNSVYSNPATGIVVVSTGGRVANNSSNSNTGSGIIVSGGNTVIARKIAIVGNTCRSNTFSGIQSDPSGTDIPTDIAVSGNVCDLNNASGIFMTSAVEWAVTGNICRDNNADGIGTGNGIEAGVATNCVISGNVCYDSRAGASRTQTSGIGMLAQVAANDIVNVSVTGNVCYNNLSYGIRLQSSGSGTINGVSIVGNNLSSNGANGIFCSEVAGTITGCVVANNVCLSNTTSDLRLDPLDMVVSGNKYATMGGNNPTGAFTFTSGDTTPSVKGRDFFLCSNGGATIITAFTNGAPGQVIEILFTNANTTLTDGGTLKLNGGFVSTADDMMRLRFDGTNWYEVSRSVN